MPIDFHAGFWINNPDKIIQPKLINRPIITSQPAKDTFLKNKFKYQRKISIKHTTA